MLNLFKSGSRWPIALDVGTESIKMLQLTRASGGLAVRAGARWRFPESSQGDSARRKELAIEAIREMLRKHSFRGRRVVSCLSCNELGIKNVRLPHLPPAELAQAVSWEARERFSFPVDENRLNYIDAGQIRQGSEVRSEVIMLAASEQAVENHLDLLDKCGLVPEAIDAEPASLFRPFERYLRRRADEDAVSVVVNIGHSGTRVIVARGRHIIFIKSIDVGGKNLTDALAGKLNLSYSEARDLRMRNMKETARIKMDDEPSSKVDRGSIEWTIHDAVRGEVEALAKEISLCLRYCSVTFRGLRPKHVTLTGGEVYDNALLGLLDDQLGVEIEVGQPLRGFDTSSVDLGADRRATLSEWTLCTGLALRDVDFSKNFQEDPDEAHRLSA